MASVVKVTVVNFLFEANASSVKWSLANCDRIMFTIVWSSRVANSVT